MPAPPTISECLPTSDAAVDGGCSFAEDPDRNALEARIVWSVSTDSAVLRVTAVGAADLHRADFDVATIRGWRAVSVLSAGAEHVALCDGCRTLRLDIEEGSLFEGSVTLRFRIDGLEGLAPQLRSLENLRRIAAGAPLLRKLDQPERRMVRWLDVLRVYDALQAGARNQEIGEALFGAERLKSGWRAPSDALQSRVRRLVAMARRMVPGEYRWLLAS